MLNKLNAEEMEKVKASKSHFPRFQVNKQPPSPSALPIFSEVMMTVLILRSFASAQSLFLANSVSCVSQSCTSCPFTSNALLHSLKPGDAIDITWRFCKSDPRPYKDRGIVIKKTNKVNFFLMRIGWTEALERWKAFFFVYLALNQAKFPPRY